MEMGWLVLSVLGFLLIVQVAVFVRARGLGPQLPKATLDVRLPDSPDDSMQGF